MILLPPSDRSLQRIPVVGNAKKTTGNPHVSSMATTGYHAHLFHPDAVTTTHQSQSHGNCSATARGKLQTSWGDGWYSMSKAGQGVMGSNTVLACLFVTTLKERGLEVSKMTFM